MPTPLDMPRRVRAPRIAGRILSRHALERLNQMGLVPADLELLLEDPEDTWTQDHSYGADRTSYVRDNIGCVVSSNPDGTNVVVTVMWRYRDVWKQRLAAGFER